MGIFLHDHQMQGRNEHMLVFPRFGHSCVFFKFSLGDVTSQPTPIVVIRIKLLDSSDGY